MKDSNDVIKEFNQYVNMTASELETWLKADQSHEAGWPKDEGDSESVGRDSGKKITAILKANPKKEPSKYTDDQVEHMRRVVAYCKRHLAQESKMHGEKSTEEIKKSKSYISLKNWGHDPLKNEDGGSSKSKNDDDEGEEEEDDEEKEKQAGDKRKASSAQKGKIKKQETAKGKGQTSNGAKAANGSKKNKAEDDEDDEEDDDEDGEEYENGESDNDDDEDDEEEKENEEEDDNDDEEDDGKENGKENGSSKKQSKKSSGKGPKPGDTVSWNWGSGQPKGKVLDVKEDKATIETKRGNKVSRDGDPEDPAVILDTGKSKAIKSNHELN